MLLKNVTFLLLLVGLPVLSQEWQMLSDWETVFVNWDNPGTLVTADNPLPDDVNSSARCGLFTTTPSQWDLLYLDLDEPANFDQNPRYSLKVLAPPSGGKILYKFENAGNTFSVTIEKTPTPGQWDELLFDFSNEPQGEFVRMVIFIDLLGTQAGNEWYLDDLRQQVLGSADNEPPTPPSNVHVSWAQPTTLQLTWTPSQDNGLVSGYQVSMNGKRLRFTRIPTVDVTGLQPETTYSFSIIASDQFGNSSEPVQFEATTTRPSAIIPATLNFRLGTQTFGPSYWFTDEDKILESSRAIRAMGTNIVKFALGGSAPLINRLDAEPYKTILDMDFTYYFLWVYGPSDWFNGQTPAEGRAEYDAVYAMSKKLLERYNGTGKVFYIGHWEGDWHLVDDYNRNQNPLPPLKVSGMIDWLNSRQLAIEDAKKDVTNTDVHIYQYTEVNLVVKSLDSRLPSLTTEVLPNTTVDYVSYSSYDAIGSTSYSQIYSSLNRTISFIEKYLPAKEGLPPGRRVFIGEYGYPYGRPDGATSPEDQDRRSRNVMQAGLRLGCPFVLYWEMYNNEVRDGVQWGFWMINDRGIKQPIYYTHRDYYARANSLYENFVITNNREPDESDMQELLLQALEDVAAGVRKKTETVPDHFDVQAFPNPFNAQTMIRFFVPVAGKAFVTIYAITGKQVRNLEVENRAGEHTVVWDGLDHTGYACSSGVYIVSVHDARGAVDNLKLTLLK
ncbi:fibronectin type III domain-containing protein [candidate division KSB1 bacterium]|nr:fibronectin type III domain-containing protein [candidate division KSB1 bacterium]